MKPTIPPSSERKKKGRSHPFLGSRELKGNSSLLSDSFLEGNFPSKTHPIAERLISPRDMPSASGLSPHLDVLMVSKNSFNMPVSNRLNVQNLEESTHKMLKDTFFEEKMNRISKYERHLQQIQILDNSMKDLCALINKNCKDQANFVWKLWSSAADLYQEVLKQLLEEIENTKRQIVSKTLLAEQLERKVITLSKQQGVYSGTNRGDSLDELTIIRQLEEELNMKNAEFTKVQETMTNLSLWFPHFAKFGGSVLGRFLPPIDDEVEELFGLQLDNANNNINNGVQDDLKNLKTHFYLAQDYLVYDLKRLEKLGIGLDVSHSNPTKPSQKYSSNPNKRDTKVSNKLSIALNQPEELQALSYGLFGGPQSSVSFSSPHENEYNLRHIDGQSIISPKASNYTAVSDVDAAVERVVSAVAKSKTGGQNVAHAKTSAESDFDIRLFHTLQYRRASNLSIENGEKEGEIDLSRFVGRDEYDSLNYVHHHAMHTIQELEKSLQHEQQTAAERIAKLEKELKITQLREKALKEQLKECKNEADSILVCLPVNSSLPPVCTRDEAQSSVVSSQRKKLLTPNLSTYTIYEVMSKVVTMLDSFTSASQQPFCASWNLHYNHLDNAVNGHNTHWMLIEPRDIQISASESFRSISLGLMMPSYSVDTWKPFRQVHFEANGMASSVTSLIIDEIMKSYRENHLNDHYINSSQTPWEMAQWIEKMQSLSSGSRFSDHLLFLSRMLGFRIAVEAPENETDYKLGNQSVLMIGIAEGESSVVTNDNDLSFLPPHAFKPSPPMIYLQELPIKDQRIFFDIVVHCYEAVKSCGSTRNFFVPIHDISKVVHKVFAVLNVSRPSAPFDVAQTLLDDHGLHMRPWWRYLSPSIESRLQEECLRMAMDIDQLADVHDEEFDHDEEDENDRRDKSSWLAPRFQCLNFSQLTMNCYHASLEFERVLRRILQEIFVFVQSLVPEGPSSPLYITLLERLLQPSFSSDHGDNVGQKIPQTTASRPSLPFALVEELMILEASSMLTASRFADAVLRCAPTNMVDHLCSLICLQEHQPVKVDTKNNHSLEQIARTGLNFNLYQQMSGALDYTSDDVLGRKFAKLSHEDTTLSDAWRELGVFGVLLLRFVEHITHSKSENLPHPSASHRGTIVGTKAIPALASSIFLKSVHYRRVLYGTGVAETDDSIQQNEPENSSTRDGEEIEEEITFTTRIQYHLQLCFDTNFLSILDASTAHKWLTTKIVQSLISHVDLSLLHTDILPKFHRSSTLIDFRNIAKNIRFQTTIDDLQLDQATFDKRANLYKDTYRISKTFKAWREICKGHKKSS